MVLLYQNKDSEVHDYTAELQLLREKHSTQW